MSATTFLRRRNYAGDTCKNEEFPAATFGKAFCNFRYLGLAKNKMSEKKYSTVEIAADMTFPGHAPVKPKLCYMQREPIIQNLISMRMDKKAPLLHQKLMLKLSNSSGIKESDALRIDAVLKGMKCSGNASVAKEAKNESRRYLEYEIDF